jgi:phage terminase large subunit
MRIYVKLEYYEHKLSTQGIYDRSKHVGNALIVADSAESRLVTELAEGFKVNGVWHRRPLNIVECIKGPGSIAAGISKLLDYEIIVDPDSVEIGTELNNYIWLDRVGKIAIDEYNHALDALRYIVTYLLRGSTKVAGGRKKTQKRIR